MKKSVLFIDDDEGFLFFMERVCSKIEVISSFQSAQDGKTTLDMLIDQVRNNRPLPNMMFVDIVMPGMGGCDFIRAFNGLKEGKYPQLREIKPIIMLTSSDQERDKVEALKMGVSSYLIKPNGIDEAIRIVTEAMR